MEPRAKQASRGSVWNVAAATPDKDSKPVGALPPRMRVGFARSRHGGRSYLGEAQASPMRNGTYRGKALSDRSLSFSVTRR